MKDVDKYEEGSGPMMFVWQALVFARKITDVLNVIETRIASNIGFDKVSFLLLNPETQHPSLYYLNDATKDVEVKDVTQISGNLSWRPFDILHEKQYMREEFLKEFPKSVNLPPYKGLGAYCFIPLKTKDRVLGGMELIKLKEEPFNEHVLSELQKMSTVVSAVLDSILERTELKLKERNLV